MKEELYMQNAMIIDPKDNVAVAIEPIAAGDTVTYLKEGKTVSLKATEDITIIISWLPGPSKRVSLW